MNRSEIVQAVARKHHLHNELVDDIIGSVFDMITLCLSVDEDVSFRGFGRFRTRRTPDLPPVRDPRDGGERRVGRRRYAVLSCSPVLKQQLNGDPAALDEAQRSLEQLTSAPPRDLFKLRDEALHRYLWGRLDARGRVGVNIAQLADTLGVSYDTANNAIVRIRKQGRIRHVGYSSDKSKVYEVADPRVWRADDESTHLRRPSQPTWG